MHCPELQANSVPVGAAVSALSAATPAASGTTGKPGALEHAATAPAAALHGRDGTADMELEEAGAESQPLPLEQLETNLPEPQEIGRRPVVTADTYCEAAVSDNILASEQLHPGDG